MSIQKIRFRAQDNLVILQVCVVTDTPYSSYQRDAVWRDAKVEDLLEVSDFCKTDMSLIYESFSSQISKLRDDIFNRMAPAIYPYQRPLTDEERYQIDALNQHQERDL